MLKTLSANTGDAKGAGSPPGLRRPPGEGNGNPLQYSCLENPMDRGAWWYCSWGHRESDMVQRLSTHTCLAVGGRSRSRNARSLALFPETTLHTLCHVPSPGTAVLRLPNKSPQAGWLQTTGIYSSTALEARSKVKFLAGPCGL